MRWIKWVYRPLVARAVQHPVLTTRFAVVVFLAEHPRGAADWGPNSCRDSRKATC